MTSFLELNRFKKTLIVSQRFYRSTILKSSILSEPECFSYVSRIARNILKKIETIMVFQNFLTKNEIILKKAMVHGCLQYGMREKCVTLLSWIKNLMTQIFK